MSGGSYDYLYLKVAEAADKIGAKQTGTESSVALRRWFADHLKLVAEAMHDIEWVDSADYGCGDECAAIRKVGEHVNQMTQDVQKMCNARPWVGTAPPKGVPVEVRFISNNGEQFHAAERTWNGRAWLDRNGVASVLTAAETVEWRILPDDEYRKFAQAAYLASLRKGQEGTR